MARGYTREGVTIRERRKVTNVLCLQLVAFDGGGGGGGGTFSVLTKLIAGKG